MKSKTKQKKRMEEAWGRENRRGKKTKVKNWKEEENEWHEDAKRNKKENKK